MKVNGSHDRNFKLLHTIMKFKWIHIVRDTNDNFIYFWWKATKDI
jgi:hypothetical protein